MNELLGTSWHSYPKIYNMGHRELKELLLDSVTVEEKVDGSQFSFGRFGDELRCRSRGQQVVLDAPGMFALGVKTAQDLFPKLREGWTYRGEYLQNPKHNALAYDRVPNQNFILFDVNLGHEEYMPYVKKKEEADRLGLEIVPLLFEGIITDFEQCLDFLKRVSILGGQEIEGFVIKNYNRFGADKKALMGKFVSEKFKEVHRKDWKKENKTSKDVLLLIGDQYRSKARWEKAVQHLKERGEYDGSPKDIGNLIKEVQKDVQAECKPEIMEVLYKWGIGSIVRKSTAGLPEWYKEELLKNQFKEDNNAPAGDKITTERSNFNGESKSTHEVR